MVQCLCQLCVVLVASSSAYAAEPEAVKTPIHNYPTVARMEYVNNATPPGEGGGIFRDSDRARQLAKRFRELVCWRP
jgi:hypothetical protein